MSRVFLTILLLLVIVAGSWVLVHRDEIKHPQDAIELVKQRISAMQASVSSEQAAPVANEVTGSSQQPLIRVASYKLTGVESDPSADRLKLITEICSRFDAIALQGIDGRDDRWLKTIVDALNSNIPRADYHFISDHGSNDSEQGHLAIVFDGRTLDMDPMHWYTVNDPDQLLNRAPLVGWFRTKVSNPTDSFTFSLVNIELASVRPDRELAYLDELYQAIRDDGRGEDDVIMAGDFNSGDRGFEMIKQKVGLTWVVSNTPTDIRRRTQYDNLVFNERATVEYTGRGGVFDFVRKFNLRLETASRLSDRLPVWAEFTAIEGHSRVSQLEPQTSQTGSMDQEF